MVYMKRNKAVTKCKKHNDRKLSLYCNAADCRKPICELCLIKEHVGHEVVDIAEEQKENKETIKIIARKLISELSAARENLLEAKNRLEKDCSTSLAILKERKRETIHLYNKMIESVADQGNTCKGEIDKEVSVIDGDLKLINDITTGGKTKKSWTSVPLDELKGIQQIKNRVQKYLRQEKALQYYKHSKEENAPENSQMRLKDEKIVISFSDARNSNSRDQNDGVRPVTSANSIDRRNEVRPTGTGSTSSMSYNKRDEVRPTGTGSTSSNSTDRRTEVRPIGKGSTSSNSTDRRNEVQLIGTGSSGSHSSQRNEEVRLTGRESTSSSSIDRKDEIRPIATGSSSSNFSHKKDEVRGGSTSSSANDKSDEARSEGMESCSSRNKRKKVRASRAASSNSSSNSSDDESYEDFVWIRCRNPSGFRNANTILLKQTIADIVREQDFDDDFIVFNEESEADAFVIEGIVSSVLSGDKLDVPPPPLLAPVLNMLNPPGDTNYLSDSYQPPTKKMCTQKGDIVMKVVKSFEINRSVTSCGVLSDGSLLVLSRRNWKYYLIKYGPENNETGDCVTLKEKCHAMTEMVLSGRRCLALTSKKVIEFRDLNNLEEVVASYSADEQDFRSLCFYAPLNVLFYENRCKNGSSIHQLDCRKSPPILKNIGKEIKAFTEVNEMCFLQHGNEHLLVTAQRRRNSGVCVYDSRTGELKWSRRTVVPNTIPAVTVDGAGNILVCDSKSERIYKLSATGEILGLILRSREQLFDLSKMQWCSGSSSLTLVYKNFWKKWCVIAYKMDTQ